MFLLDTMTRFRDGGAQVIFLVLVLVFSIFFTGHAQSNSARLPEKIRGGNLSECSDKLNLGTGGWCEIRASNENPSISSAWPEGIDKKTRMITGPSSILIAWNSAAYDEKNKILYFMGGGHADYGGNEVYQFDLAKGKWSRLTEPSPLDYLYISFDYNARNGKPWRRLCWMPDTRSVPGSSHTYDGLIFSSKTRTIFLYSYGSANGSCFEDKDNKYKDHPAVLGGRSFSFGWFEFNPSTDEVRNNLPPLTWRKVFDKVQLESAKVHQSYPVSVELPDGDIVFGSKLRTTRYDPKKPSIQYLQPFTGQADWGDGLMALDKKRNIIWSIHQNSLIAYSSDSGNHIGTYKQVVPHGKSIAINKDGLLLSWDGSSNIYSFDPDEVEPRWKLIGWGSQGPSQGSNRVYGKWVYVPEYDVFVGLSVHTTGVWVYRHPQKIAPIAYATESVNTYIKRAKPGEKVVVPKGVYGEGVEIRKSITVDLRNASIRGVASGKGIVNIDCNGCRVEIINLNADGIKANCLGGNCAGIKVAGKNFHLIVRDSVINNTVIGVLSDNRGGEIHFINSVIENTGRNDRSRTLGHGFYAGDIDRVVMKNSIIRRSFGKGHLFKSRAAETEITNSVIAGLDGRPSRVIDFPCGGKLTVKNSVLQQGKWTDNIDLISVGTEPQNCGGSVPPSDVTVKDNWIIFEREETADEPAANHGFTRMFTWRAPVGSIEVTGNRIVDKTGRFQYDGEGKLPDTFKGNDIYENKQAAGFKVDQLREDK